LVADFQVFAWDIIDIKPESLLYAWAHRQSSTCLSGNQDVLFFVKPLKGSAGPSGLDANHAVCSHFVLEAILSRRKNPT
jgi:hypothetical protein